MSVRLARPKSVILDGQRDLAHHLHRLANGQWPLRQPGGESRAFHILHCKVQLAVLLADQVNWDDAGVAQASGRLGFEPEALAPRRGVFLSWR
jgi:hypothetical protein